MVNEQNGTVTEASFRVSMKQLANKEYRAEFTVRSDSIEDLKSKFAEAKDFVVSELRKLNG